MQKNNTFFAAVPTYVQLTTNSNAESNNITVSLTLLQLNNSNLAAFSYSAAHLNCHES